MNHSIEIINENIRINIYNNFMNFTRIITFWNNFPKYKTINIIQNQDIINFYSKDGNIEIKLNDHLEEIIFNYEDYTSEPHIIDINKFKLKKYNEFKRDLLQSLKS